MEKGMNLESFLFRAEDYEPARKYLVRRYVSDIDIRRLYAHDNLNQDIPKKLFNNQVETDEKGIIWLNEGVKQTRTESTTGTDPRVVIPIK